jgi:hypothetical protein
MQLFANAVVRQCSCSLMQLFADAFAFFSCHPVGICFGSCLLLQLQLLFGCHPVGICCCSCSCFSDCHPHKDLLCRSRGICFCHYCYCAVAGWPILRGSHREGWVIRATREPPSPQASKIVIQTAPSTHPNDCHSERSEEPLYFAFAVAVAFAFASSNRHPDRAIATSRRHPERSEGPRRNHRATTPRIYFNPTPTSSTLVILSGAKNPYISSLLLLCFCQFLPSS